MKEILWLLGILAVFFFIWVMGGGPERAQREGVSPVINGSMVPAPANTAPNNAPTSTRPAPATSTEGEMRVTPV